MVAPAEYDRIVAMRDRPHRHPTVQRLARGASLPAELSIVWDDAHGLRCKARLDLPVPKFGVITDIKPRATPGSPRSRRRSATSGYAQQAAHPLDGAAMHWPHGFDLFVYVVVENEPPHEVIVYELDTGTLRTAWAEVKRLRSAYRTCIQSGHWPGYSPRSNASACRPGQRGTHT